jgi:thymidylate synthase
MQKTADIRDEFRLKFASKTFAENATIEIINASFIADEKTIFGTLNSKYAMRELHSYYSQNLNVNGLGDPIPKIWQDVSDEHGLINSNYGWCIFSDDNHNQLHSAVDTLRSDKFSRQAQMIYTRPTMHEDANKNGMHDFMCTMSTQLLIRDSQLHYMVYMRSSDAVFGYKNDRFWHDHVHKKCLASLKMEYPELKLGNLYWNAASIHVYARHFNLIKDS